MPDTPDPEAGGMIGLPQLRDATIEQLCKHFAADEIEMAEFERRVDLAHAASSRSDLEKLLADLTPVSLTPTSPAVPEPASPATRRSTPAERDEPARPVGDRKQFQPVIAVLSGATRRGRWRPAEQTLVVAVMGGAELDLREAQLDPGVTEIDIVAIMGGVEIIVPPGLAVETGVIPIMGGLDDRTDDVPHADPDQPLLRVRGLALMGGVDIQVRLPGESARDAKRRRRDERRQLRSGHHRR